MAKSYYEPEIGDWVQFYYGGHLIIDEVCFVVRALGGGYVGTMHHGKIDVYNVAEARPKTPGDDE